MTTDPVYVVLGGTGRLGRHLLPKLRAQGHQVIGVSRRPDGAPPQSGWVHADLTAVSQWPQAERTLLGLLAGREEAVLVDLLLDRTSVTSMRRSISAATTFAVRTSEALTAEGISVRVLAASTTAALAPFGLQTPYGKAKRQQALHYKRLDRIDLVLLPQLLDRTVGGLRDRDRTDIGAACTYEAAATALLTIGYHPARRSLWVVRGGAPRPYSQRGFTGLPRALGALVVSRTIGRNSPAAHRRASHELLALLPPHVRARVDHHGAPELLLRAFERRLGMPPARTVIASGQAGRQEEDDAQHP